MIRLPDSITDGSGYPGGLKGEKIPLLYRILAVSESYNAMTNPLNSNSPGKEEVLNELRKMAGSRFDPKIVQMFSGMLAEIPLNMKRRALSARRFRTISL